jgi:outer membrane protein assembly factor BamA
VCTTSFILPSVKITPSQFDFCLFIFLFVCVSSGFGLVFPTQLGRLEANYCWVLTSQEHDRVKRGFSFGFAANMGM